MKNTYDLKFDVEPYYIFNGTNSYKLPVLHTTEKNRGDVTVYVEGNGKRTNIVIIEVNSSSPMLEKTVGKVLHGLLQLLGIVKAYDIHSDLIKLVG